MTNASNIPGPSKGIRIDRWLWAARFYKTRSAAKSAVEGGKIHVDGARTKPAKDVRIGQSIVLRRAQTETTVIVDALSEQRGPAPIAQTLYHETLESIESRQLLSSRRKMERAGLQVPSNRPNKKERRDLLKLKNTNDPSQSQA